MPRLRLVGAEPTAYTESGDLSIDLSRFRTTGDGYMDEVHARRNALGADLMVLVVGDVAGGACGVGYVMTSLSSSFAPWAFSVTAYPCISPNYTFAHELGHNMGSAHAPEDGAGPASLYPYSFGYKHPANLFRTVMAYNCTAGCPRVLHFSNPDVPLLGCGDGHRGTAQQRAVDQQRREHPGQLPPGGGRRHDADDLGHLRRDHRRGLRDLAHRLHGGRR